MSNQNLDRIFGDIFKEVFGPENLATFAKRLQENGEVHIHMPFGGGLGELSNGLAELTPEKIQEAISKKMAERKAPMTLAEVAEHIKQGKPLQGGILVETEKGIQQLTPELMREVLHRAMNGETFNIKTTPAEKSPEKPEEPKKGSAYKHTPPPKETFGEATKVENIAPATVFPEGETIGEGQVISRRKVGDIPYSMEEIEGHIQGAQKTLDFWIGMQNKKQQEIEEKDQKQLLIVELNKAYEEIANLKKVLNEFNDNLSFLLLNEPEKAQSRMIQMQQIAAEISTKKEKAEELRLTIERIQQI